MWELRLGGRTIGHMPHRKPVAAARTVALALLLSALAACQAPGPVRPAAPPSLKLLGAAPLEVPASCQASGSVIVAFAVDHDGTTSQIQPAAAPACLQQALTAWVASFRYAPPVTPIQTSVEWLMVEARRGS